MSGGVPELSLARHESLESYRRAMESMGSELRAQRELEHELTRRGEEFDVGGFCYPCRQPRSFRVTWDYAFPVDGVLVPNWREHLFCRSCALNGRMRATVQLVEEQLGLGAGARVYITEQVTALYAQLHWRLGHLVGSEFISREMAPGEVNGQGIRHEDLTRLSFGAEEFDAVLTFDVLEHVPDYLSALRECYRVLKPGGRLLISVPFRFFEQETLVRATVADEGTVTHLQPPEIHGDPLCSDGCLAYYNYGWDLLDDLKRVGFVEAAVLTYWSRSLGYLGAFHSHMLVRKGS